MVNKISIRIPQPCQKNWEAMTSSEKGKFCDLCQKNVIDFTTSSDREILKYYNQNSKLCGRFHSSQINRNLFLPKEKSSLWLALSSAIVSFLGLGSHEIYAHKVVKTEQTDNKIQTVSIKKNKTNAKITGIVTDAKGPIPGVNVFIKGTTHRTQTNLDGSYSIKTQKGDTLIFSYIGYKNVEKKISGKSKINVMMKEDISFLGEVIIQEN